MKGKKADPNAKHGAKKSLSRRILRSTTLNILALVVVSCMIMAYFMLSLANNILLDSLQPMARQSAKTVEANIHMLADRMMALAGDGRLALADTPGETRANREAVLAQAAELYELYTIALYDLDGQLVQGLDGAPERLDGTFFALLQETDNLTTHPSTVFQGKLGITMGIPVKEGGETALYMAGVYKYDTLNDVISSINIGKSGLAYIINREESVIGHPDQSLVLQGAGLDQLGGGSNALDRAVTGETGSVEFFIGHERMLAAYSPIRGTQWSLVLQMPKSDYHYLIGAAMLAAILATLAVLAISILLVLHLSRSISRPVGNVTGRMVALSGGDLHTEVIPAGSGDELELLTQTLDTTVGHLNQYISDIQQVLTQIANGNLDVAPQVEYKGDFTLIRGSLSTIIGSMNRTISGFRAAAARLADMSEELNGQSNQLHQASLEQHQSAQALVDEVSQAKARLDSVTQSTGQTRNKTEEIAQRVQEANTQMAALSGAMDNISANTQEIAKIAKSIEDIALQTNILAINASVEAARAGSAGKGFAVVAGEVRQLASKSAQAAQSATEMVDGTRALIQTGVQLTAETAGSIQAISGVSAQISTISDELVMAVRGQQGALAVMEERIEAISAIADRNLQNAGGTQQSSGLLAQEAEDLQSQVVKFVLKGEGNG